MTFSDVEVLPHSKRLIGDGFVSQNDMLFCAVLERGSGKNDSDLYDEHLQ